MAPRLRGRRSYRSLVEAELEILPLMGLFVVLIPMLLLSAVFLELSVIKMNLPSEAQAQTEAAKVQLSVRIEPDAFVLEGNRIKTVRVEREDAEVAAVELAEEMQKIAEKFPGHEAITVVSEPKTAYEDIILVMDASREAGLSQVSLAGDGS